MNSMNDQHFFDLAMKAIANQATDTERAELDSVVAGNPQLKAELERLRAESRAFKEVLPLVEATEANERELPGYARARLQTKVRQTFGSVREQPKALFRGSRSWVFGLATATAVVAILLIPMFTKSSTPIVQVAVLDLVGATRSTNMGEVEILTQVWRESQIESFSSTTELDTWKKSWPEQGGRPAVKVIYDRSTGEVRVIGRSKGQPFQKAFPVEPDLQTTLRKAVSFIEEQTTR